MIKSGERGGKTPAKLIVSRRDMVVGYVLVTCRQEGMVGLFWWRMGQTSILKVLSVL